MRDLLEYLARALVDDPESVSVEQFEEDDGTVVLELAVAEDDYGKVIGRGGRTANALRSLVKAAAGREGRKVLAGIVDCPCRAGRRARGPAARARRVVSRGRAACFLAGRVLRH